MKLAAIYEMDASIDKNISTGDNIDMLKSTESNKNDFDNLEMDDLEDLKELEELDIDQEDVDDLENIKTDLEKYLEIRNA